MATPEAGAVRPAIFVTIATPDRAEQSRVLARSARACHADVRLAVLALEADGIPHLFDDVYDLVITPEQLSLSCFADMRFRYSTAELCFALKPWILGHLFEMFPDEPVYYLDSDIEIFTPLVEADAALAGGAHLLLSPHLLTPAPNQAGEEALLRSGTFNGGFLAVAPSPEGRAFAAWWGERLKTGCTLEATCGDQKWLDLVPSIFPGSAILRHPGYNFAFWNVHERPLVRRGGVWTAAGEPLRFVHYTKWNLREHDWAQYLAAYFDCDCRPYATLFADYQEKVRRERRSDDQCSRRDGAAVALSGGRVAEFVRGAYARHGRSVDGDSAKVFDHAVSVLNAPSEIRADLPVPITVLYDEIWLRHPDLRSGFDIDRIGGRLDYLRWLGEFGAAELDIPDEFMAVARSALDDGWVRQFATPGATARPASAATDSGLPGLRPAAAWCEVGDVAVEWLPAVTVGSAGERNAAGISTKPGCSGHLFYGPYARLRPGDYRVRVACDAGPPPCGVSPDQPVAAIEAVAHHGRHYLAQRQLHVVDCASPVHELVFQVGPAPLLSLEVRMWTGGMVALTVTSITVEGIAAPAPIPGAPPNPE